MEEQKTDNQQEEKKKVSKSRYIFSLFIEIIILIPLSLWWVVAFIEEYDIAVLIFLLVVWFVMVFINIY
ncbi:hypothetical protein KKI23_03285, partial [Patescibacteria group bacterium]|nr:hypothetical protein [Patescibacteria group bacterium]